MDDLQLNITVKRTKKSKPGPEQKNASEYKFLAKARFEGKTIARKRPQTASHASVSLVNKDEEPQAKVSRTTEPAKPTGKSGGDFELNLRDLSQNKGKFQGIQSTIFYQNIVDELAVKQKPRSGGWISSLFKNNPDVPRTGQRAVKTIVEKVFAGRMFSDLNIHPHSVANLQQNLKILDMMTVQQNAVPVILQGRDVLIR